jgi:inward rectifier potassium channel
MSSGPGSKSATAASTSKPEGKNPFAVAPGDRERLRNGIAETVIVGRSRRFAGDLYHKLLTARWWQFFVLIVVIYAAVNTAFAGAYLAFPDSVAGAHPGSFTDAFFFSVETMATIGYGVMSPRTLPAHVLVTCEALLGMLFVSMATGLMFAKFARPTARIVFSRAVVIGPYDGAPSLMIRMANARANQIVEATARLVLLRNEYTREGVLMRRFHDLKLTRASSSVFALSWTIFHPLTPDSPLHGLTREQMLEQDFNLMVSVAGLDDTFGQTVHARWQYWADEIVWNARFRDVLSVREDGRRVLDMAHFHSTVPLDGNA